MPCEWQNLVQLASYEFCRHWTCRQSATQNLLIQKPDADIYKCLIMIDFSIYNIESNQLTTTAQSGQTIKPLQFITNCPIGVHDNVSPGILHVHKHKPKWGNKLYGLDCVLYLNDVGCMSNWTYKGYKNTVQNILEQLVLNNLKTNNLIKTPMTPTQYKLMMQNKVEA